MPKAVLIAFATISSVNSKFYSFNLLETIRFQQNESQLLMVLVF